MAVVKIFGVRERDTNRVRYIGWSKNPKDRVEKLRSGRGKILPITDWLREEHWREKTPVTVILEECEEEVAPERIVAWMKQLEPDLNTRPGRPSGSTIATEAAAGAGQPDVVPVGWSVRATKVVALAEQFGISAAQAMDLLECLGVPTKIIGPSRWFDMFALESALHRIFLPTIYRAAADLDSEFALWLQSVAAMEYASMDGDTLRARLRRWHRKFTRRDTRKQEEL